MVLAGYASDVWEGKYLPLRPIPKEAMGVARAPGPYLVQVGLPVLVGASRHNACASARSMGNFCVPQLPRRYLK